MVLEQILKVEWIQRGEYAFFIGFFYAIIAIASAYLLSVPYLDFISVSFVALLLLPTLNEILRRTEIVEEKETKWDIKILFKDHWPVFKTYFLLFFGVFFAYFLVSFLFHIPIFENFNSITGAATQQEEFQFYVANNLLVLFVVFVMSLFYGAGTIYYLSLNAAIWGAFFGFSYGDFSQLFSILPHTFTEGLSYVSAGIAGGVLSAAVIREKMFSKKFNRVIRDALIFLSFGIVLVFIAAAIETHAF